MSFEAKKEHSIAIMESKKMWRCNYAPPCYASHGKLDSRYHRYLLPHSGK